MPQCPPHNLTIANVKFKSSVQNRRAVFGDLEAYSVNAGSEVVAGLGTSWQVLGFSEVKMNS